LPTLELKAGARVLWDGRFAVCAGRNLAEPLAVSALGAGGLGEARKAVAVSPDAPVGALRALPAFWRGGRLLAVPPLGLWAEVGLSASLSAAFLPARGYGLEVALDVPELL
jgi:hypothetical protein